MTASPVRVLYCESNVDGTVGGSHYCLLHLVGGLDRARYVPLVAFYQHHSLVERFRAVADTLVLPGDEPVQWGGGSRSPLVAVPAVVARRSVNLLKLFRKIAACVALIRRHGIGVVHLNNSITRHHEWMWAARLAGVPCVVSERGLPRYGGSDRTWSRRVAAMIPVSMAVADGMLAQGIAADRIRVIYDGLDPGRLVPGRTPPQVREEFGLSPDQPLVGIVGNIREWKGQETVVRALRRVVDRHPDLVCLFVGGISPSDEDYHTRLRRLVADGGLERHVRFTGFQRDIPGLVHAFRFLIHASIAPEPFGMVVLEAMALRRAVIGARAGGVPEMIVEGATGTTVPPADPEALAAAMIALLDDPARTAAMGERGHQRVLDDFQLASTVNDIQRVYDDVLAGRPPSSGRRVGNAATR